jgi:hypothetical protein
LFAPNIQGVGTVERSLQVSFDCVVACFACDNFTQDDMETFNFFLITPTGANFSTLNQRGTPESTRSPETTARRFRCTMQPLSY